MKPGIQSTEFWALPAVLAAMASDPDNAWPYAAAYAAYAAARAATKILGARSVEVSRAS